MKCSRLIEEWYQFRIYELRFDKTNYKFNEMKSTVQILKLFFPPDTVINPYPGVFNNVLHVDRNQWENLKVSWDRTMSSIVSHLDDNVRIFLQRPDVEPIWRENARTSNTRKRAITVFYYATTKKLSKVYHYFRPADGFKGRDLFPIPINVIDNADV